MPKPKLLLMSGSLRAGSFNKMLLREAARAFGEADVTEADLNLPLYNGDEEDAQGVPELVHRLADQIADRQTLVAIDAPSTRRFQQLACDSLR